MTARLVLLVTLGGLGGLGALGCRDRTQVEVAPPAPTTPPVAMDVDDALVLNLAKLAIGTPPPPELLAGARKQSIDVYIDALLAGDAASDYAAKAMVIGSMILAPNEAALDLLKLHSFEADVDGHRETIYHLLEPCDVKDAVSVQPWWSTEKIKICKSSYEPTHLVDPVTGYRCGSKNQSDELRNLAALRSGENASIESRVSYCGCGPSLVFCVLNDEMRADVLASLENEVTDTVMHVVREDRPLEEAFTRNETYRDAKADFFYQRPRLIAGEIKALPPLDKAGARWQPRKEAWPGQQAGVFTATHMIHLTDGVRDRMRDYFYLAWCKNRGSHGATAEQVLALGVTDLRSGDGWQKLAAMPLCTSCHARLDYGMQFFLAYPSSYVGFFDAHKHGPVASGPLYGDDISDARGTAELTPAGFARLVVADQEFGRCVAGRISHHVLGDSASPDDITALENTFAQTHRVKPVLREALKRFAQAWQQADSAVAIVDPKPDPADAEATMAANEITVPQSLRKQIDTHCSECHDDTQPKQRDFSPARLDRSMVAEMLHRVAWGDMPRNAILRDDRVRMTRALIHVLWPKGTARETAERYYLSLTALPIHTVAAVRSTLPRSPTDFGLEQYLDPAIIQSSPNFVAAIAKSALVACGDRQGAELERCIHEQVAPVQFTNRRLPWLTHDATAKSAQRQ